MRNSRRPDGRQYLAEGPDAVAARHQAAARAARAGVRALGLRLWAADEAVCADTVTAVAMPPGAGAAADVGAAVEAVLSEDSYRGAIKPECHRGTESAGP